MNIKDEVSEAVSRMMRTAFAQAVESSHGAGAVEIHVSQDVRDALTGWCSHSVQGWQGPEVNTAWGFPVVVVPEAPPLHVAVHVVYTIY